MHFWCVGHLTPLPLKRIFWLGMQVCDDPTPKRKHLDVAGLVKQVWPSTAWGVCYSASPQGRIWNITQAQGNNFKALQVRVAASPLCQTHKWLRTPPQQLGGRTEWKEWQKYARSKRGKYFDVVMGCGVYGTLTTDPRLQLTGLGKQLQALSQVGGGDPGVVTLEQTEEAV